MNAAAQLHGESRTLFGTMFPKRRANILPERTLLALAETMNEGMSPTSEEERWPHSTLDAGYTYLGQFIDHDLTSDRSPFGTPYSEWWPLRNFRTPRFDLDCLYGRGPWSGRDGDLYEPDNRARLLLAGHDLVRKDTGRGHLRDTRNDTNRIVSQIHVAFAKFHNRVVDTVRSRGQTPEAAFAESRSIVQRHYQWIVLHEYLPVIVGQSMVDSVLPPGGPAGVANLRFYRPGLFPSMPLEFSAAAFRLGHSMVRTSYRLNLQLGETFLFTAELDPMDKMSGLRGLRPLPAEMVIEWDQFFAPRNGSRNHVQLARPIDPSLASSLFNLPPLIAVDGPRPLGQNLAYRNLVRGEYGHQLPTGQEVAGEMLRQGLIDEPDILGKTKPFQLGFGELSRGSNLANLAGTQISLEALQDEIKARTPLWYYVLKEAEVFGNGERLGKVGGRIVAEVFIGLLQADRQSILQAGSEWRPTLGQFGCVAGGCYRMTDLLSYVHPSPPASASPAL